MTPQSYMLLIEKSSQGDLEHTLAILNIAGVGGVFYGRSNDFGSLDLWLIYKAKNNPEEVKKHLEAIPPIKEVTVVTINSPINVSEITDLRALFLKFGWDAQDISDTGLSMFVQSLLHRLGTHYIDYDHQKFGYSHSPVKIKIKCIQDHPDFSPDWLKQTNFRLEDLTDKVLTKDDFTVETFIAHSYDDDPFDDEGFDSLTGINGPK